MQPTPFCNIDCRYCYLPDRASTERMSTSTLEHVGRVAFSSACVRDELTVVWHAGEPTVLPVCYYERAIEVIENANHGRVRVRHAFQTNGTLLNDEWCAFFIRHGVSVGVSIDGPREVHDAQRIDRRERGTFDRALHGIRKLREWDVPFHCIAVLSAASLTRPREIWDFFASVGAAQVGFNFEETEGAHARSSLAPPELEHEARIFLEELVRCQEASAEPLRIREVDGLLACLRLREELEPHDENAPLAIVSVDVAGNVSTFSPELLGVSHPAVGRLVFGNVAGMDAFEDILLEPRFRAVAAEIRRGIARCRRTCGYFEVCRGGAPSNKLAEHGSFDATETLHCRLRVMSVVDAVLPVLERACDSDRNLPMRLPQATS